MTDSLRIISEKVAEVTELTTLHRDSVGQIPTVVSPKGAHPGQVIQSQVFSSTQESLNKKIKQVKQVKSKIKQPTTMISS